MRQICESLPEVHAEVTWGSDLNFRVRKKIFCFPGEQRMTVKADPDEREALLADSRFEPAAYVGRFGWVTMDVSGRIDWAEITELIHTSYCLVAPKTLARQVADGAS